MNEARGFNKKMEKDTKKLFQITEAAHACGISRSTLMRMEEKGLIKPAYIATESGRRYYDNHNVARVLQIEKFQGMGVTTDQIVDYFARGGEISSLLAALEHSLYDIQRSVEELRLRIVGASDISVQVMNLPAVTCRMRRSKGHTIAEKYADMYDLYSECVRQGCVLSEEPLFTISHRHDYLEGYISDEPYPYDVCVPVRAERAPAEAVVLPECCALSVLYYGDYSGMDKAWLALGSEAKARGLTPIGSPRVLGIVAPYTGREIETKRYCSRFVLPVAD